MSVTTFPLPELLIERQNEVGEGPCVDPRTDSLVWVDIAKGILHERPFATGVITTRTVPTTLGAVAPRASQPGFASATAEGFGVIDEGGLTVVDRCLPEPELRMNDAKPDARGRFWAGSTELAFEAGRGRLHRWDGVSPSSVAREGFTLPNGLGWNDDSTRMYLVDSVAHEVFVADFDLDDGVVGEFAAWASVSHGLPDGLAVDVEGCVWVAVWGGSEVIRLSPRGELIARVPTPVSQPSSCAISADGTLYITSARAGLSDDALRREPLAGSVFAVPIGVAGVPVSSVEF